ncbi:family 10 glycosylhydrolase [Streptosporangium soli]|nr:family 10 glycosylhydrolase [Streptosporangium sp. KLBMP 9127]
MRTGHREKRPIKAALLAAAALAVASTSAAYFLGPNAAADQQAADDARTPLKTGVQGATAAALKCDVNSKRPKRQLRGVWIATVKNIDWPSRTGLSRERQQAEYRKIMDNAVKRGLNAVFVQVRPASDAFYKSPYEPWSQYLTGTAGKDPGWDPLPFLVAEAHKRGLEFHAWFNPYRAAYDASVNKLPADHPARKNPGWVVKHENLLYYNPGLPDVRDHVTKVVTDVVNRYDVDGVHFDDYFYPYPGGGAKFADQAAFKKYGKGEKLADWRRDNVNKLIAQVDESVHTAKPYVKFGVSPFGIWRNVAEDPSGSRTSGMSAYDQIYADARAWIKEGTVDYVIPQLYWPRGLKVADYSVLAPWWAKEVKGTGVHLYIGQALYRVGATDTPAWTRPGELPAHLTLNRKYKQIRGDVYFSAKQLATNPLGVLDRLGKEHYARPALLPLIKERGGAAPPTPSGLKAAGATVTWNASEGARGYAVYRVDGQPGECATADAGNLVALVPTGESFTAKASGTYLVTSLDRLQNESKPAQIAVKLR